MQNNKPYRLDDGYLFRGWLRSPNTGNANNVRNVNTSGTLNNNNANNSNGVAPDWIKSQIKVGRNAEIRAFVQGAVIQALRNGERTHTADAVNCVNSWYGYKRRSF